MVTPKEKTGNESSDKSEKHSEDLSLRYQMVCLNKSLHSYRSWQHVLQSHFRHAVLIISNSNKSHFVSISPRPDTCSNSYSLCLINTTQIRQLATRVMATTIERVEKLSPSDRHWTVPCTVDLLHADFSWHSLDDLSEIKYSLCNLNICFQWKINVYEYCFIERTRYWQVDLQYKGLHQLGLEVCWIDRLEQRLPFKTTRQRSSGFPHTENQVEGVCVYLFVFVCVCVRICDRCGSLLEQCWMVVAPVTVVVP